MEKSTVRGIGVGLGAFALAASLVVAGGMAFGGPNDPTGGPAAAPTAKKAAKSGFAVVRSTGSAAGGSTTFVTSNRVGTGEYEVIFNFNVTFCAYEATLGVPGVDGGGSESFGSITTARRAGNPNGVWVQTSNLGGSFTDHNFHLRVTC